MKEWNVYVNGKYVGTVHARNEELARRAASSSLELSEEDELSVALR